MYHDLKVDGTSLKGYKVYINGTEAYNSAERDVEFIEIPGRSGAFALDKKRFKNITVQYNSGTFAENQPEFARKISDLRNFLASRDGYVRIEDDYNPEEYRMGVFSRGLEFDPVCYNMASEFPIEFNCKPQRFLKIGDLPVSVASGDTLTNPTLFDAKPLIKFNSSGADGTINLGNEQIKVLNAILGRVNLELDVSGSKTATQTWQDVITVQNAGSFNVSDILRFNGGKVIFTLDYTPVNVEVVSQGIGLKASWQRGSKNIELSLNNLEFPAGTGMTYSDSCSIKVRASNTPLLEETKTFTATTSYSRDGVLTITWEGGNYSFGGYAYIQGASNYTGYGDSTKNNLEDVDIYIDLNIGEAYSVDSSDNVVSLNNFANLGGELPALPPGSTTISYSNTISNVEITPHWWRV